jgi:TonB family protein
MTAYRTIRLALLCALMGVVAMAATPQDKNHGHDSRNDHNGWSNDCVDNQALPERGVDVPHDREPVVIKQVEPEYPRIAKQAGLTGTTQVAVLVDRCGKVRDVAVDKSSGTEALDEAAVTGVRQWRFRPGEDHGKPVAMWVTVPIEFKLSEPLPHQGYNGH